MNHWTWACVDAVLVLEGFILALALTPWTIRLARRAGWISHPDGGDDRRLHAAPMPVLGGLAIIGGFLGVVFGNLLLAYLLHPLLEERIPEVGRYLVNIPSTFKQLGAVLGGALAVAVLGLVDDRRPLGPWSKLAVMTLAAVLLPASGVRIEGFLPSPWMGAALTVVWVVFVTNSLNFLDNMDGLCAGVAAIIALAFGLISFFAGEWFMAAIYAVLAGALLGFLRHNFNPARLFMGDNGSLFTGYLIGALSVLSTYYERDVPSRLPVLTPVIVLGVPIFDTMTVMWIRLRTGRPLMLGDRNHFSHRLVDLGMSPRRAVTFIYIVTAAVALGAVPLRTVAPAGAVAILAQVSLLFWAIYRLERTARGDRKRLQRRERRDKGSG